MKLIKCTDDDVFYYFMPEKTNLQIEYHKEKKCIQIFSSSECIQIISKEPSEEVFLNILKYCIRKNNEKKINNWLESPESYCQTIEFSELKKKLKAFAFKIK
ncbi:MAG: hypothetical protein ABIJ17_02375 [Patescibacteria group bacterium]